MAAFPGAGAERHRGEVGHRGSTPRSAGPVSTCSGAAQPLLELPLPALEARAAGARPTAGGKFLHVAGEKLYVKGVTYGTFAPDANGDQYPAREVVRSDFEAMAGIGLNAVRVYTPPPTWLLDLALEHGLKVMVGLDAERSVGHVADRKRDPAFPGSLRACVRPNAGHPAILCYAVGNELPAPLVRWLGARRTERHLERLCSVVKDADPGALVTYVNYPTTEYLELPFLDLLAFNVYLESQDRLDAYLARLQNLAGDRPLLMTELGLDSARNGVDRQAEVLGWQLQTALAAGCAGAFVYAWTDEWYRNGQYVTDWDFGLTGRDRRPKRALATVARVFADLPPRPARTPRVSVLVCTCNGSRTIAETLEALEQLTYPDYEVIVVDDGSTDGSGEIARSYDCSVVHTENFGLSHARNVGLDAATGEIVAYIDDDAYPDPDWLWYLVTTFEQGQYAAVGGPNIPPPGDAPVAECVASAPGGPIHVLLDDRVAEHLPGCNMAFRADVLRAIGGFDPQFRIAGDDVDICWRLRAFGHVLGFSPAAMVWHHRRSSVRAYLRQQRNYGKAEALLERKWPEKYNAAGHVSWHGRLYNHAAPRRLPARGVRIYHGRWGSAPFQSLYERGPTLLGQLPAMPEWYGLTAALGFVSALGALWTPLVAALPLLVLALGASLVLAAAGSARLRATGTRKWDRVRFRAVCMYLNLMQPLVRLRGRVQFGLHPWRQRGERNAVLPRPRRFSIWCEHWRSQEERLQAIKEACHGQGARVWDGGAFERWDLEVRGGVLAAARLLIGVEERGGGCQLVRFRVWPRFSRIAWGALAGLAVLGGAALLAGAWIAGGILCGLGALLAGMACREAATAQATLLRPARASRQPTVRNLEMLLRQAARRAAIAASTAGPR
jgi:GT2 family glycosyltransferase